tara:strand:+ start:97 stop:618 length:522 start_codon:yes stop_codon:yes gene_type:complete
MKKFITTFSTASLIILGFSFVGLNKAASEEPWKVICDNPKQMKTCLIRQQLFLRKNIDGKEKMVGRVLSLTVIYGAQPPKKVRTPYLSVQMPLGLDLRPGAVMRIDSGKEYRLEFLQCTTNGCDASIILDQNLIRALKMGNQLQVGFRPWGTDKTNVVPASLSGFTKAFGRIK